MGTEGLTEKLYNSSLVAVWEWRAGNVGEHVKALFGG